MIYFLEVLAIMISFTYWRDKSFLDFFSKNLGQYKFLISIILLIISIYMAKKKEKTIVLYSSIFFIAVIIILGCISSFTSI